MIHRESGVYKTSYAADMALFPLPVARWALAACAGLFIVVAPLSKPCCEVDEEFATPSWTVAALLYQPS